jgi:hypothetical protein
MLIAKTQEESDLLVEQEISHMLCLNIPTVTIKNRFIVDNNHQAIFEIPQLDRQRTIKTKKYGTLCLFDSIKELLDSKYNKAIIACFCSDVKVVHRKKYTIKNITLEATDETLYFEDREQGDQKSNLFFVDKDYETNKIKDIEKGNGYLLVIERNKFLNNGVQIIDSFRLKG